MGDEKKLNLGPAPARPVVNPLDLARVRENFPGELLGLKHFCLWNYGLRRNSAGEFKWTKPPFQPNGMDAESDNPVTWSSLDAVAEAYAKGGYDGIGFFFAPPYIGVDFDKVRDPRTGIVEQWAQGAIQELASYTEISPSGTGFHVLLRGELPPGRRRAGRVEIYQVGRYFTVTGVTL